LKLNSFKKRFIFFQPVVATYVFIFSVSVFSHDIDVRPNFNKAPSSGSRTLDTDLIETHESIVYIGGVEFRQIEYKGKMFYLNARQPEAMADCRRSNLPKDTAALDVGVKVTRRSKLFLEGLRQYCDTDLNAVVTDPNPRDVKLGVSVDRNKRIFVQPLNKSGGASFSF